MQYGAVQYSAVVVGAIVLLLSRSEAKQGSGKVNSMIYSNASELAKYAASF